MGKRLYLVNWIFRYVFGQNKTARYPIHYTSQVIEGNFILSELDNDLKPSKSVLKSFAQSGNCYYQGKNGIHLGEGSRWGPGVKFISADHDLTDLDNHILSIRPIMIGKDVLIGANSAILPGVQLGNNVIVGIGSIVTKSFQDGSIIAGNPAKFIK